MGCTPAVCCLAAGDLGCHLAVNNMYMYIDYLPAHVACPDRNPVDRVGPLSYHTPGRAAFPRHLWSRRIQVPGGGV